MKAIQQSFEVQDDAAKLGFDWPHLHNVLAKVQEEANEVMDAHQHKNIADVEEELGDLLFVVVNATRHLHKKKGHSGSYGEYFETIIQSAVEKFQYRFEHVSEAIERSGKTLSLDEMEKVWQEAKQR